MAQEIRTAFLSYLSDVGHGLAALMPRALSALLMLLSGFVIAYLLRSITRFLLRWLRFNALMERAGASQVLQRAGMAEPDRLLASLVFWLTWLVLLLSALRALGLPAVGLLAHDFIHYIPKLASAFVIIILGVFLSNFAWRASLLAAVNAQLPAAKLVGMLVRTLTLVAALAMALEQLEIGQQVILTAFAISFGAIMLALALAFGLGGRHLARRYLEQRLKAKRPDQPPQGGPSHL